MLTKLSALLSAKGGETFGFRLARELEDCGKDIMAVFGITDFHRDYENVWEWVEGERTDGWHINVSRPHGFDSGNYDIPVIIRIRGPLFKMTKEFLSERGQMLADRLQTEVWIGRMLWNEQDERRYGFEIEEKFAPAS